jgi:hypothetical protein
MKAKRRECTPEIILWLSGKLSVLIEIYETTGSRIYRDR